MGSFKNPITWIHVCMKMQWLTDFLDCSSFVLDETYLDTEKRNIPPQTADKFLLRNFFHTQLKHDPNRCPTDIAA